MYYVRNTQSLRAIVSGVATTINSQSFSPFNASPSYALFDLYEELPLTGTSDGVIRLEISNLYDDDYVLKRPIPVVLRAAEGGEFVASLEAANIAMSGTFASEALRLLREHIVALYAILLHERLGPEPQRQRDILETYIGENGR